MMSLVPGQLSFNSHKENINVCDFKTYVLYRNGLFKTCRKAEAIELLKAGWYDKTKYQPKEEVLSYGLQTKFETNVNWIRARETGSSREEYNSCERQHEEIGSRSESSSGWQKSGHEQYQPDLCNDARKEHLLQTIRPGQECSEVVKKRGRPKKVK